MNTLKYILISEAENGKIKGQTSYFTNLEGWRIEKLNAQNPENIPVPEYRVEDIPAMPEADDLPFWFILQQNFDR